MTRRLCIYAALVIVMAGAWYLLLYAPLARKHAVTATRIDEAERQLVDFRRTISELPGFVAAREQLLKARSDLHSHLYAKNGVLKLLDQLEQEAAGRNLTVTDVSPPVEELLLLNSMVVDSTQPGFLNIQLELTGSYVDFGKYVAFLETAEFFRGINGCHIAVSPDDKHETTFRIGFKALLGGFVEET